MKKKNQKLMSKKTTISKKKIAPKRRTPVRTKASQKKTAIKKKAAPKKKSASPSLTESRDSHFRGTIGINADVVTLYNVYCETEDCYKSTEWRATRAEANADATQCGIDRHKIHMDYEIRHVS